MIPILLLSALWGANAAALPTSEQQPLGGLGTDTSGTESTNTTSQPSKGLTGRFLHITDIHSDPYYTPDASSKSKDACHRGEGSIGYFGAEGSDCDSPLSLVNETLRWIENNLKDQVDFVVVTGDSARHDNDDDIPRTEEEVMRLNSIIAGKLLDAFDEANGSLSVPIVPTIGNNDIMPHNIFYEAPNKWTRKYLKVWEKFIPEEQRHTFVEGGWFTTEVIPNKLAVVSLNTMYFYESNSAVDGCKAKSEPGYEQFEWLRKQLKLLRARQMKAILIGHVPPARAGSKRSWTESCWQKYALWVRQYRDVVVGGVYGHMNIDHFMLQDHEDVEIASLSHDDTSRNQGRQPGEITIRSKQDYLSSLREEWSELPTPPAETMDKWLRGDVTELDTDTDEFDDLEKKKKKDKDIENFLKEIGGLWAERYAVSLVSPSVVPNFFPTIRVIEYNITGLEKTPTWADITSQNPPSGLSDFDENEDEIPLLESDQPHSEVTGKKKKHKKKKKKKKPNFIIPDAPSSTAPPGPAYSNQPLTWLSYTQYFANLTRINSEYDELSATDPSSSRDKADVFSYQIEYDTKADTVYRMKDLTVRSYFKLASQIALKTLSLKSTSPVGLSNGNDDHDDFEIVKKKKSKKKENNQYWKTFVDRAYVGFEDVDDIDE